jgi:hypothetical protein
MKQFLVIGLAAMAIAAFAPQTYANPPVKKPAPAAVHMAPKGPGAIHTPFRPAVGHVNRPFAPHPVHAAAPFHNNPHGVNPRLAHEDQFHRTEATRHEQQMRDERLHANEHERLRDERIAHDRDARLRAQRADYRAAHSGGDGSGGGGASGGGDDSSADAAGGDSSDDSSGATDPKAAALSTILNLLQKH